MTPQDNELLTRIGPGTRMGALLRRYWYPVAGVAELDKRWTQRVKLLGENLVLFKDRTGKLGLIGESCPHRRASLYYGIPTEQGIRCPYHGWMFDSDGRCIDQPNETERHALKDKVATPSYPVQEMGGLIFAYLGPAPAPELPRFDIYTTQPAIRSIGKAVIPCNWLQIMENSADPVHTEWLHGKFFEHHLEERGFKTPMANHHLKIAFDEFEFGLMKRRLREGQSEDSDDWRVGHPLLFPNVVAVGFGSEKWSLHSFQIRVPMDDTQTMHFWYQVYVPAEGVVDVPQRLLETVPVYDIPLKDKNGDYLLDYVDTQDAMVWVTQGAIADRAEENLGVSDRGVAIYRSMLKRELDKVEAGKDPMGVVRDSKRNAASIELPFEKSKGVMQNWNFEKLLRQNTDILSPIAGDIIELFRKTGSGETAKESAPAK